MAPGGDPKNDRMSAASLLLLEPSRGIEWSTFSARPQPNLDAWERPSKPPRVRETRWVHGPAALLTTGARIEHGLFEPALSLVNGAEEHINEVPDHAVYTARVLEVAAAAQDSIWARVEVETVTTFNHLDALGIEMSEANTWMSQLQLPRTRAAMETRHAW